MSVVKFADDPFLEYKVKYRYAPVENSLMQKYYLFYQTV